MIVRHHPAKWNIMCIHQVSGQLGGPVQRFGTTIPPVLTHLDGQALVVSRAVKIGMFTLLIVGKVLHTAVLIHGVVPRKVSDPVTAPTLTSAELAVIESHRVPPGIRTGRVVLGAVNRDIFRVQTSPILPGIGAFFDIRLLHISFRIEL